MNEVLTLFELNSLVHEVIEDNFDEQYWVVGELSDVSTPAFGGHFYGELVQKDEESDRIVARARITCWARNYNMIRLRFQKEAGETLRKGLQVKLLVEVNFHEQYGYSLNVVDIDSTFTLGDLAKRRREILQQLERTASCTTIRACLCHDCSNELRSSVALLLLVMATFAINSKRTTTASISMFSSFQPSCKASKFRRVS